MQLEYDQIIRTFAGHASRFAVGLAAGAMTFCVAALAMAQTAAGPSQKLAWKAGTASVLITPQTSMWMAGYAFRDHPSEGKETELYAKALALEDEKGTRLVIVTYDLNTVPRVLRDNLEKRSAAAYKLLPESLLVNASHTHSGPEFRGRAGEDVDSSRARLRAEYARQLEEKLFTLIGAALGNMEPARLGYAHARAGFAMNRRLPTPKGYEIKENPDGPVDHAVPVLRIAGADGKLRAVLFGYACHNTTLASYEWNADYAGYARDYIQAAHPGVEALFLSGCGGDQNPYPRRTVELCRQHGRALANAVEVALVVAPRDVRGPLRSAYATVDLDYANVPTREELEKRLASDDPLEVGRAQRSLARLDAGEKPASTYPYPVQVIRFSDDIVLAAISGEAVVDYSLRLKRELAGQAAVWVAAYSNDVMSYIPSKRVREEGGYESGPFEASLEERIIGKVHELNRALQSGAPAAPDRKTSP